MLWFYKQCIMFRYVPDSGGDAMFNVAAGRFTSCDTPLIYTTTSHGTFIRWYPRARRAYVKKNRPFLKISNLTKLSIRSNALDRSNYLFHSTIALRFLIYCLIKILCHQLSPANDPKWPQITLRATKLLENVPQKL